ncbi:MAG: DUF1622 domain-containing protein [Methanomicrobia archaeon]|nr:DUF1622 domain-containing protein [Methanomicrobia archaeon]
MDPFYYIYTGIAISGMAIIVWGVVISLGRVLRLEYSQIKGRVICREREALRHQLGSYLLLGLEFLIAADIIRTITDPTLEEMAILGGIVAIRTVLSYFLDKEMAESYPCEDRDDQKASSP